MAKYLYTDDNDEPLAKCPQCGGSLTAHGGVTLLTTDGRNESEWETRLLPDGSLEDVNSLVENGQHSCTKCGHCHELLIDMEGVNEQEVDQGRVFELACEDEDGVERKVRVRVKANGSFLEISPEGYGECCAIDGCGSPVVLDLTPDGLQVHVFGDVNSEDPTLTESLEGARETARRKLKKKR